MAEELRPIKGFEGIYSIDTFGNVYRVKKTQGGKVGQLKWTINRNGYATIRLRKDNKCFSFYIHKLVAETFIPNPDNKPHVDHIDTNVGNNHVSNLRWVTAKENSNNPLTKVHHIESVHKNWENKEYKTKVLDHNKKIWSDDDFRNRIKLASLDAHRKPVVCIELNKEFSSVTEASKFINGDRGLICKCASGKYSTAYGYHWEYLNNNMMEGI